jgi:hypothetical protein
MISIINIKYKISIINYQLSIINYQLSIIKYEIFWRNYNYDIIFDSKYNDEIFEGKKKKKKNY